MGRRILLSPSAYYPSFGGIEEIARNLSRQYAAQGHEVVVVANRYPLDLPETEIIDGTAVKRFEFGYPALTGGGLRFFQTFPRTRHALQTFIEDWRPDVIHVIGAGPNALYVGNARKFLDFRLVTTVQGERFMDSGQVYQKSRFARLALRNLLKRSDHVTACSQYVLDDLRRHFKFEAATSIVFNGIALDEDSGEPRMALELPQPFILGVGRLVHNKGFDILLRAFQAISATHPDLNLVLAGDGDDRGDLQALASELDIQRRVVFLGRLDRAGIAAAFRRCEIFALPSPVEPFGIVCLEAMRAGKPIVATDSGGPREFLQNEREALLVRPQSVPAMAQALARLLDDRQLALALGRNGSEAVRSFSWDRLAKVYLDIYRQISVPAVGVAADLGKAAP